MNSCTGLVLEKTMLNKTKENVNLTSWGGFWVCRHSFRNRRLQSWHSAGLHNWNRLTGLLALIVRHHLIHSPYSLTYAIFSQTDWTHLPASLQLVSPPHTRWLRLPEKHLPFQSERDRVFAKHSHTYHQYGGGIVAQWLALSFHSNKVQNLFLCGHF